MHDLSAKIKTFRLCLLTACLPFPSSGLHHMPFMALSGYPLCLYRFLEHSDDYANAVVMVTSNVVVIVTDSIVAMVTAVMLPWLLQCRGCSRP